MDLCENDLHIYIVDIKIKIILNLYDFRKLDLSECLDLRLNVIDLLMDRFMNGIYCDVNYR